MGKSMKLRDLRSADVQKQTDAQMKDIVLKGKGKMPAQKVTDAQAGDLVKFVRSLK
jgi:mono/diheme cytochrome c family protein